MSREYYVANATSCSSSRWLTEEVHKLIDIVKRDEAIYNPRHKYYFCRPYVENFWREVDLKLEKNPGASLGKWTNLRISFRREYTNYLEEKVPPCWSYFDRMFFLHPYLRKKHQQPKSLDSQVQDALVQISSLSDRLQRERAAAAAASLATGQPRNGYSQLPTTQQPLDNYLEYFDDAEPNNSDELDDLADEEQQTCYQNLDTHSLNNEIKSECEEHVDFEHDAHAHTNDDDDDADADDTEMRNFVMNSLATNAAQQEKRQQLLRLQHLNRLQMRSYHDDLRAKRPRSHESITSVGGGSNNMHNAQQRNLLCTTTPTHSNVSFVRPTFAKPISEVVSTTTTASTSSHVHNNADADLPSSTVAATSTTNMQTTAATAAAVHTRHLAQHHAHHHRLEIAAIASGNVANTTTSNAHSPAQSATHLELCECKTDPDAMFLMSLLPDIQKLNGRDRGKIKIAFQNILQDYLYPD